MEPIYKILQKNRNASLSVFKRLVKIKGITCRIFIPTNGGSIFGLEDLVNYNAVPDEEKKLLFFNLFQESFIGDYNFDPFVADVFFLTTFDDKYPLQTKIVLDFMGRELSFKIDDHKSLTPHIQEQLFIKNQVVALL
jgi:hypothetical protein